LGFKECYYPIIKFYFLGDWGDYIVTLSPYKETLTQKVLQYIITTYKGVTMKTLSMIVLGVMTSSSLLAFESTVGTTGYMRVQTSLQDGKANLCFKAPGASSKYRLGNECETWIELGLYSDIKLDSGINVHLQVRPIIFGDNNERLEFFGWGEAYAEISGLFDNGAKAWIGRRFYERYDSHISDYFYLNSSGDGIGIKDIALPNSTLSYALFLDRLSTSASDEDVVLQRHDIRWQNKSNNHIWTVVFNYDLMAQKSFASGDTIPSLDGFSLGVLYKNSSLSLGSLKGDSISGLFYGEGLSKNALANVPNVPFQLDREGVVDNIIATQDSIESSKTYRVVNFNTIENDSFGLMTNFVYESRDDEEFAGIDQDWLSIGLRGYWFAYKNFRAIAEIGYDLIDNKVLDTNYKLLKNTVALEMALDRGVWKRPVLRLYYTNANWNNEAKGLIGGSEYADTTSADNIGVQLEYWW